MRTELRIARRLRLGTAGRDATGVVIAVTGIAISLIVMMIAVAVMNGFKNEIRAKVTGFEAQVTIMPTPEDTYVNSNVDATLQVTPISLTPQLRRAITETLGNDARVTVAATRPALLKTDDAFVGIAVKAYDDDYGFDFLSSHITDGSMPDYKGHADSLRNVVVISSSTAQKLNLKVGNTVMAYFFGDNGLKARKLTIGGIYNTHFGTYDNAYLFATLPLIASVDNLDAHTGTRIEINGLADGEQLDNLTQHLRARLLNDLYTGEIATVMQVQNVNNSGAQYFNWLSLLDTNVVVILVLMGLVSAFTLVSSMFILILERVNTIGLLKAIGASNGFVRRVFIAMAERIVARGLLIGNAFALLIIIVQGTFHLIPLDAETYYLNYVPVDITVLEVVSLNAGVVVMAAMVLILPSHIIARISPARTMRYE